MRMMPVQHIVDVEIEATVILLIRCDFDNLVLPRISVDVNHRFRIASLRSSPKNAKSSMKYLRNILRGS